MKRFTLIVIALIAFGLSYGQLTGIKNIPGDYLTIEAAIAALNTSGVGAGGVTFNVAAGHTETFSGSAVGTITTTTSSSTAPIVFQKSGAGTNPLITAAAGTSTSADGIIKLEGTDYVTFDGIDLLDPSTHTTTTTQNEWGYAILVASATDASQHITIKNCTVTLQKICVLSKAIYSNNHNATSTTGITPTDPTGTVSFCDVDNCNLSDTYIGIYFSGYSAPSPYTLYSQGNRFGFTAGNSITNFGGGSSTAYGIYVIYQADIKIANNTINGGDGTTTTLYGMYLSTGYNANVDIYGNTVTVNSGATTYSCYGISNAMGGTGSDNTINIYNNNVENCTYVTGTTGSWYLLYSSASAATVNVYGNNVRNNTKPTTGTTYALYISSTMTGGDLDVHGNSIYGNSSTGASGTFYCAYIGSTSNKVVYDNNIYNNSSGGGTMYGMYQTSGYTVDMYRNNIYGLTNSGSTGYVRGVYISSGTNVYMYNNYISDLNTPASSYSPAVTGVYVSSGTSHGLYYNTIYLDATSTGTNFGSAGIYASTTPGLELRNNIIANTSIANGTGLTVAYWRSSATLGSYATTSDNNDFYAGAPGVANLLFTDGTNDFQFLSNYKTHVTPADANSFTSMPPFVNSTTTPYDLHISTTIPSQCESGGGVVSTPVNITTDFDNQARYPNPGYPNNANPAYAASAPDVGADEFGGIPLDITPPGIAYTPLNNTGLLTNRTLTATITDGSGVPTTGIGLPVCYWKINAGAWNSAQGVHVAASDDYTFAFGAGVAVGDVVSYYVVAQDLVTPPNVGANPSVGASGFTPNPPACSTPTTAPNTYTVVQSLSGTVTVGTGGTYLSLTGAGGLFADINAKVLTGNVTANIISNLTEDGTNALNQWAEDPPGNFTVTIQPSAATERVIEGAVADAMIRFEGARNATIDGRFSSSGKYLRFRNTNTSNGVFEFSNDAMYNTLRDCYWESGNTSSASTASGVIRFYNSTGSNGNDFNTVMNNVIRDRTDANGQPYAGIYAYGSSSATNSDNTISGNEIFNYTTYGVYLSSYNGDNWTISGNSFYNNLTTPLTTSARGIYYAAGSASNGAIIAGNYIGGSAPMCGGAPWELNSTGSFYGMYFTAGSTVPAEIYNNVISNISNINTGAWYIYGIYCSATGVYHIGSLGGNTVGSATIANSIQYAGTGTFRGIYALGTSNLVENNIVGNVTWSNSSGSPSIYCMYIYGADVKKNKVFKIGASDPGLTPTIYGIYNYGSTGIDGEYSNNIVDLDGGVATNPTLYAFYDASYATSTYSLYYNTFYVHGPATTTSSTYAWRRTVAAPYILKDNIFFNGRTAGGTGSHYAVYDAVTATLTSDYNDIYSAAGPLGYFGGADVLNLAAWQVATTGDVNSVSADPTFVSATDLHPTNLALNNAGVAIPGITTDYDGITRGNPPDMGALEFSATPAIVTTAATGVTGVGATLNGTVNANGESVTTAFEYGLTTAYGSSVGATPSPVTGSTTTPISAAIGSLVPNTLYHFRAMGTVNTTNTYGADLTFTTLAIPPTVVTTAATGVGTTTATVNGTVNANNATTTVTFEYGLTTAYGSTVTAPQSPVSGTTITNVNYGLTGLVPNTLYHYRVKGVNAGGTSNGLDMTFTTAASPPVVVTNPATAIGATFATLNGTVTASNQSTTVTFQWGTTPAFGNVAPASPSPVSGNTPTAVSANLTGLTPVTTYYFRCVGVNATGTTYGATLSFLAGCPPIPQAGPITGPTTACANSTGHVYSIDPLANATAYTWSVPTGATITAGAGTTSITVTFGTTSGNVSVYGTSSCAAGTSNSKAVTVNPSPTPTITGPATVCTGTTGNVYATQTGMTAYVWTVSAGGTITAGAGTASITVTWNTAGAQSVTATYTNASGCAAAAPTSYPVTVNARPTPTITGPANICQNTAGNVYTTQAGMTNYAWTVSAGGTITAGGTATSNTVTVTWTTSGSKTVGVNYTNAGGCAATTPASYSVTVNPLPMPTISGNASPCVSPQYVDYYTEGGNTGYVWTVSAGGTIYSGQGTSHLQVIWNMTGLQSLSVNYTNSSGCTLPAPTTTNIFVNPVPAAAGTVTGTATVCAGQQGVAYSTTSVMNATSYSWYLPAGATIASGAGTTSITVNFGAGTVSGNITVAGANQCGDGPLSPPFPVTVNPLPAAAGTITGDASVCQGETGVVYSVATIASATGYAWTLPAGATITAGNNTKQITVSFSASASSGVITVHGTNTCGSGANSPDFSVTVNPKPATPTITESGGTLTSSAASGNQWYFNGTAIPGATGQTYEATQSGDYYTIVTLNGCSSDPSNTINVTMIGINQLSGTTFNIYPVPNDGKFSVTCGGITVESLTLEVYNYLGVRIYDTRVSPLQGNVEQIIDLRPVPNGVYTVVLRTDDNRIVRRILVNK